MKKSVVMLAIVASTLLQNVFGQANANQLLQPVITAYINLKDMLAKDNADGASIAAKNLFKAIEDVPMEKLSANQHKVWMKLQKDLSYDAEHIKNTDKIDHQREHFAKLSKNVYTLTKELSLNSADMYYQYCPMAEEGKGAYWLSEQKQINNPYMGKMMPTCGSNKETIKAVKQ